MCVCVLFVTFLLLDCYLVCIFCQLLLSPPSPLPSSIMYVQYVCYSDIFHTYNTIPVLRYLQIPPSGFLVHQKK